MKEAAAEEALAVLLTTVVINDVEILELLFCRQEGEAQMPRKGRRSDAAKLRHQKRMQAQQLLGAAPPHDTDEPQQKPGIFGHDCQKTNEVMFLSHSSKNSCRKLRCRAQRQVTETPEPGNFSSATENTDAPLHSPANEAGMAASPSTNPLSSQYSKHELMENVLLPNQFETSGQIVHSPSVPSLRHGRKRLKSDILSSSGCSDSTSSWVPIIIDVFSLSDPKRGKLLSRPFPTADSEETNDDLIIQESSILL